MRRLQKFIAPALSGTVLFGLTAYHNNAVATKSNEETKSSLFYSKQGQNKPLNECNEEEQVLLLAKYFQNNPKIRDAVTVRAFDNANDMNMFGRTVVDKITKESETGKNRYSLQIHPYPWQPAGSIIVPIWRDVNGVPHVVLVHNQRKDKDLKQWRLSEGFMHPKPCAGSDKISVLNSNIMDEAEELILRKKLNVPTAYALAITNNKAKTIFSNENTSYDTSLEDTARREAKEEIGLELKSLNLILTGYNTEKITVHYYLVDLNQEGSPYIRQFPPTLTPDGEEIIEARWVSLKDFTFKIVNKELEISVQGFRVPIYYAMVIGQALSKLNINNQDNISNSLHTELGFETKQQLLATVINLPGLTEREKLANLEKIEALSRYSLMKLMFNAHSVIPKLKAY